MGMTVDDIRRMYNPNYKGDSKKTEKQTPQDKPIWEGYKKSWVLPEKCKENPGFYYPKVDKNTPAGEKVAKLHEINNPTLDPYITTLTDEELKAKSHKVDDNANKFNIKQGAPSPQIEVKGVPITARIVVDKKSHTTFVYDDNGKFLEKFPDAVGASDTPTHSGIRYVTGIGEYPYKGTDDTKNSKKHPDDFGPHIIKDRVVDPRTGNTTHTGEFLHGTRWPNSMGKDASHGCVRHRNGDIEKLVKYVKPGDFINIK